MYAARCSIGEASENQVVHAGCHLENPTGDASRIQAIPRRVRCTVERPSEADVPARQKPARWIGGQSQGTEQRHSAADERIGAGPGRSVRREASSASLSAQAYQRKRKPISASLSAQAYQRKPISASLSARGATADGGSPIDVIRPSAWQHRAGASFRSVAIKPHRAGSPRSACTQGTHSASSREPPVAPGGERRAPRPATSPSERPERSDAERVPLAVKSSRGSRKQRFQTGPRPGRSGRAAIARGRHGSLPYEGS